MLLFTADSFVRYLGTENPLFTGTVTGEQYHAIAVARRVQHPCVAVLTRAGSAGGGRKRRPTASG